MKAPEYRSPSYNPTPAELSAISLFDERIMARARRQRANEIGKLLRSAGRKVAAGFTAVSRWVARLKPAARSLS